jgi:hypothetical protein
VPDDDEPDGGDHDDDARADGDETDCPVAGLLGM